MSDPKTAPDVDPRDQDAINMGLHKLSEWIPPTTKQARIRPEWTDEQIAALAAHQADDRFHPYTCGNNSDHILEPTRQGWVCPHCDYRQDWAWRPL